MLSLTPIFDGVTVFLLALFGEVSWFAVIHGQGLVRTSYHPVASTMREDELRLTLSKIRKAIKNRVASLPSHQEFLDRCCARSAVPAE